jgi:hypothetical protein
VIRTSVSGLLFAFIDNSTGADHLWRSMENGDASSWVLVGATPGGGIKAIGYDPVYDDLYVAANSTAGPIYRLPDATSGEWAGVVAADWAPMPSSGGRPGYRGFTVLNE